MKTRDIHRSANLPNAHPMMGPRTAMRKKSETMPPMLSTSPPAIAIPLRTTNRTTAEPSLSNDSPSIVVESDTFAPSSRSMATTATGSVAEVIVPNSSARSHDQSG